MNTNEQTNNKLMMLIEGNIGAGKTTVGRTIAASGHFDFIEEPTTIWREGFDVNMLDLFYSDTNRWAFTFQICAFVTRAKTWHEISRFSDHNKVLLERSIFCDRFIFAENCYRTGLFSLTEYQLYCKMWDFMVSQYCDEPDVILYLRTPAEVCLQRIKTRGRAEEKGIPMEYLTQLELLHDEWLLDNPKTIVLNGEHRWSVEDVLARIKTVT